MKGIRISSLLKDGRVLVGLAILAIIIGLVVLNKTREYMTGKNPILTVLDVGTLTTGKISANMTALREWVKKYGPSQVTPGSPAEVIFANSVAMYGAALLALQTTPTPAEFAISYAALYNVNPITVGSGSPLLSPADVLGDYDLKDKSPGGLFTYYVYQYYFTDSLPPPPAPPKSSVPATIAGVPTPAASASAGAVPLVGPTSGPSPAGSSSTQPSPIAGGIPSPCHPSYQSVPGGSIEYRCFS